MKDLEARQQFFGEVIAQHQGILLKVANTYCTDETERQDLVQEMMIQIWKSIHTYNASSQMSTWLYRVALNVAISHYRKTMVRKAQFVKLSHQLEQTAATEPAAQTQQLDLLAQFINELQELDKALMLLYLEDKSYAEIAEIIGISITNVGTKVARIKEKLKIKFSKVNAYNYERG